MLLVGPPRNQSNFKICERRAGQNPGNFLFIQGVQYLLLVAVREKLGAECALNLHARARRQGLDEEMYFRIVAERLKMPRPLGALGDRFTVADARGFEGYRERKAAREEFRENFQLHFAHQRDQQGLAAGIERKAETRLFLLECAETGQELRERRRLR